MTTAARGAIQTDVESAGNDGFGRAGVIPPSVTTTKGGMTPALQISQSDSHQFESHPAARGRFLVAHEAR
jgi:hypothetical protein